MTYEELVVDSCERLIEAFANTLHKGPDNPAAFDAHQQNMKDAILLHDKSPVEFSSSVIAQLCLQIVLLVDELDNEE